MSLIVMAREYSAFQRVVFVMVSTIVGITKMNCCLTPKDVKVKTFALLCLSWLSNTILVECDIIGICNQHWASECQGATDSHGNLRYCALSVWNIFTITM